jgi:hypothetical protein
VLHGYESDYKMIISSSKWILPIIYSESFAIWTATPRLGVLILIYLLTAIRLTPGGSSTVHIHTQKIHRTKKNKQYIEQHKKQYIEQHKNAIGTVREVPRLGEL